MELRHVYSLLWRFRLLLLPIPFIVAPLALQANRPSAPEYTATTTMLVRASTLTTGGSGYVEPERYVAGELRFLRSGAFQDRARTTIPLQDPRAVRFELLPVTNTDIVEVRATARTANDAIAAANGICDTYIEELVAISQSLEGQEPPFIEAELSSLIEEIQTNSDRLSRNPTNAAISADQQTALVRYGDLLRTRTTLKLGRIFDINTRIVERSSGATLGTERSPVLTVGLLTALATTVAISGLVALSRLSTRILTPSQLIDISPLTKPMGIPKVRRFPALADLATNVPIKVQRPMRRLLHRIEASGSATSVLRIAVVSTSANSGTSSIAVMIAGSLGRVGSRVVMVDANPAQPDLTHAFLPEALAKVPVTGALAAHLADDAESDDDSVAERGSLQTRARVARARPVTGSAGPNVDVIGGASGFLNRSNLAVLDPEFADGADVLVYDCAPYLDTALAPQICKLVDIVVLVVPMNRARESAVREISEQVADRRVLMVTTQGLARRGRR